VEEQVAAPPEAESGYFLLCVEHATFFLVSTVVGFLYFFTVSSSFRL